MREDDLDKPATKRDLATLRTELAEWADKELESLEGRIDRKLEGLEARLIERITDSETKLLKAFYAYADGCP